MSSPSSSLYAIIRHSPPSSHPSLLSHSLLCAVCMPCLTRRVSHTLANTTQWSACLFSPNDLLAEIFFCFHMVFLQLLLPRVSRFRTQVVRWKISKFKIMYLLEWRTIAEQEIRLQNHLQRWLNVVGSRHLPYLRVLNSLSAKLTPKISDGDFSIPSSSF